MPGATFDQILLCDPGEYEVVYAINPWMRPAHEVVDRPRARVQWKALHDLLKSFGLIVEVANASPGLPDMVFVSDAGIPIGRRFLPSHFRHPERQPEAEHIAEWFRGQGFQITPIQEAVCFEGTADLAFFGDKMIFASGPRTDSRAEASLRAALPEFTCVASVELIDPSFYHLGACLVPLAEDTALWVPDAFATHDQQTIRSLFPRTIPVNAADANCFACNAFVHGREVVVHDASREFEDTLGEHGFSLHRVDLSEFLKAGGAARCLVLPIFRGMRTHG